MYVVLSISRKNRKSTNEVNKINGWMAVAICRKIDLKKAIYENIRKVQAKMYEFCFT